jgi:hypothetical protein
MAPTRIAVAALAVAAVCAACTPPAERTAPVPSARPTTTMSPAAQPTAAPTTRPTTPPGPIVVRPSETIRTDAVAPPPWLGKRVLPRRPDGWGESRPTPPALRDRRFFSPDHLPPPPTKQFVARIGPVPRTVVARSTWRPDCPLPLRDLRYATVSFWGFDDRPHTGEMIVNAAAAEDLVGVFRTLYRAQFPIEEMRVRRAGEIDAPPTGDYNNTDVFDCRPATGGTSWSQHAFGLAVDINPFHNPYLKGDLVVPELATAYLDRDWDRPGMIQPGDVVTRAFAAIGWGWGGEWSSLSDWQHFSSSGS